MTHGSSFSGIGGFDLAAEWVGWQNLFNCEIDLFCQTVLKHHFPNAEQFTDIRTADFAVYRGLIDVFTGGFPCQSFSVAGKRKGTEDDRYLWPEMLGVIRVVRPRWVVGENVYGIVSWSDGLVFEQVCADLEAEGYEVQPYVLPACGVDTGHGLLPTAQTQGLKMCENGKTKFYPVGMLPTPTAIDSGSGRVNKSLSAGAKARPTLAMKYRDGKTSRLNPLFVEEMMGFPTGWILTPFLKESQHPGGPKPTTGGGIRPSKPTETP
jgi:hypothetical protein